MPFSVKLKIVISENAVIYCYKQDVLYRTCPTVQATFCWEYWNQDHCASWYLGDSIWMTQRSLSRHTCENQHLLIWSWLLCLCMSCMAIFGLTPLYESCTSELGNLYVLTWIAWSFCTDSSAVCCIIQYTVYVYKWYIVSNSSKTSKIDCAVLA